ncbi:sporulation inhibitor of replication protein SirA [Virgibacillus sp. MSP4-1]|uniref:sporulation inhibitor of replication protein SirA n=1 Tax=Virgibacillus sp. MSP4-1 TaxID=2700081 RepID=UPI00039C0353|nr:sporulation inhibitor of replication protein SirA [Virgibacillus sp. MSP4-1]QHS22342.1 sporulation inhibitor of replication protein SirA [Virgibacillus sp. MSP4-1]
MQKFSLFLIKENVADAYYHKSDILFHFLQRYPSLKNDEVYRKQFLYITQEISTDHLIQFIQKQYPTQSVRTSAHQLYITYQSAHIKITVNPTECTVEGSSLHEVEQFVFEYLRSFYSTFFVVNIADQQFGWLSPQRKRLMI